MDILEQIDRALELVAAEAGAVDVAALLVQLRDVLSEGAEGDINAGDILEDVSALIDAALPLRAILPGILGDAAEELDGPVVLAMLAWVRGLATPDPAVKHTRADALEAQAAVLAVDCPERAERKRRRAARVRARAVRLEIRQAAR